jgi:oxygen-independent coproporphyrinogen-3 oxidase
MQVLQSSVLDAQFSRLAALPPLSLYVHVPWCIRKCPYCDFNSHSLRAELPEQQYVAALLADLDAALPAVHGRTLKTIFVGGGTPSLFSAAALDRLLSGVRARLDLAAEAEITLEANPGTFEAGKFSGFRSAGVNRLSIGVQSFNVRHLRALGRIHNAHEARAAIELAKRDFDNVNVDLMYALPGQQLDEAQADAMEAVSFEPRHISAYHLTIEPNTYFHRYPPQVPDDDSAAQMQHVIEETLGRGGYEHYETSAFAKRIDPSRSPRPAVRSALSCAACAHNVNYWQFGDYLGIGAGAHSKLSSACGIVREARYRQPTQYMTAAASGNAVQERHDVGPRDIAFEFMMNALRLNGGFAESLFEERTGLPLTAVGSQLEAAQRRGLIARDDGNIAPTALGRRFLNELLVLFLPPAS